MPTAAACPGATAAVVDLADAGATDSAERDAFDDFVAAAHGESPDTDVDAAPSTVDDRLATVDGGPNVEPLPYEEPARVVPSRRGLSGAFN